MENTRPMAEFKLRPLKKLVLTDSKRQLVRQELPERVEIRGIDVGDGAQFHATLAPIDPIIAQL